MGLGMSGQATVSPDVDLVKAGHSHRSPALASAIRPLQAFEARSFA